MYNNANAKIYRDIDIETRIMSASPHQRVLVLYEEANSALIRARIFMEKGDIAAKGKALTYAIGIIDRVLSPMLDLKRGGQRAEDLSLLYSHMINRLLYAHLHNDFQALAEVSDVLSVITNTWKKLGPNYQPNQDLSNGTASIAG